MGAYTAYIRLADDTAGNITFATVFYTTALKVGSIPNDGKIKLYLDEDVFGLLNVTNIETTSIWGGSPGSFSLLVAFDPFDSFLTITRSGGNGSTPGQVENLIIQSLNNAAIGTNHTFDIETRPANDSLDYIEYETSHDFAIFGFDFYYVQWSTGNDSWPGTRNQPWKTIQHAADVLDPGEVVIVLPGTQLEQVVIRSNGNPWGQVISYIAEGNVIVTPNSNGKMVGGSSFIIDAADWIRIHGFKCTGGTNEGILIKNAERCILYSMEVYGNTFAGIRLENVHRSSIRYSQIYNNSKGIEMTNGRTNWLRGNLVYNNNTIGLDIKGEIKESLLYENEVNSNPMGGISIDGEDSDDNQIWRNYCHSGQLYGIMINGGDFNSITENTNQSCTNGVLISGSSFSNTVDNNRIIANVLNGILLTGSARRNSIQQNACSNNNNNISLTGTGSSNSITGNTCYGGTRGIQIVKARQNRIINNNISYMSTCGIRLGTNASLNTNRGNTIQFAVIGMQIESGTNILYNNSINSNSQKGIYLKGSSSSHNKIFQNNIFGGGQINGIEIDSGNNNLITDNNAIYGHNSYGIYLYGNSFSNTISGNDIYANTDRGIFLSGTGAGCNINIISNNEIFGPVQVFGIYLSGNSSSNTIINNNLYGNTNRGIMIDGENCDNNNIILNEIDGHSQEYGITIFWGDNSKIKDNLIYNHRYIGIYTGGSVNYSIISNNQIYSNVERGIYLGGFTPISNRILHNSIFGPGQDYGINIFSGDYNIIENTNRIYRHDISGIVLNDSTTYNIINNNRIYYNTTYGIHFNSTTANNNMISSNRIYGPNQDAGIRIENSDSNILGSSNEINNHDNFGIHVSGDATFNIINKNHIHNNDWRGIYMTDDATDNNTITSNDIHGTGVQNEGIYLSGCDQNIIAYNYVHHNNSSSSYGIALNNGATLNEVRNNIICSNGWYGVWITSDGNIITDNDIFGPTWQRSGITIIQCDNNVVSNNDIHNHTDHGIYCNVDVNLTTINNNRVYNNSSMGIILYGVNNLARSNNTYGNGYGIFSRDGNNNVIEKNITHHNGYGIRLFVGTATHTVTNNMIYSNSTAGIYIDTDSSDNHTITKNRIFGLNQNSGIYIIDGDNNQIQNDNMIFNNEYDGIFLTGSASGNRIADNQIFSNSRTGIYIENDGADNNIITSNSIYGGQQTDGIRINNGDYNIIYGSNIIHHAISNGINITGNATYNSVSNNRIFSNNAYGILIDHDDTDYNTIGNNLIFGLSQPNGIKINNGDNNIISGSNIIHHSMSNGIYISGSASLNNINNNRIYSNLYSGITIDHDDADNNIIEKNTIYGRSHLNGIRIRKGDNNRVGWSNSIFQCSSGIFLSENADQNFITNNNLFLNSGNGISVSNAFSNVIGFNRILNNGINGIMINNNSDKNVIQENVILHNTNAGIVIDNGSGENKIRKNFIATNCDPSDTQQAGVLVYENDNELSSNIIAYNRASGIKIANSSSSTLFRNALYYNSRHGLWLDNGDDSYIVNNSFSSNGGIAGYDGIYLENSSDNNIIKNCIIAFTRSGHGIDRNSGTGNSLTYNNAVGNNSGNYINITPGVGTITNDPLWESTDVYSTNLLYLTEPSPCLNTGDPADPVPVGGGIRIDMGWKEYIRPYLDVSLSKTITNISLNLSDSSAIPGSTMEYRIHLLISGNRSASNLILYDRIPQSTTYITNYMGTATNWIEEYSTNDNPDQSYTSLAYETVMPQKNKIKWIRWKKALNDAGSGTFYYKVILN